VNISTADMQFRRMYDNLHHQLNYVMYMRQSKSVNVLFSVFSNYEFVQYKNNDIR